MFDAFRPVARLLSFWNAGVCACNRRTKRSPRQRVRFEVADTCKCDFGSHTIFKFFRKIKNQIFKLSKQLKHTVQPLESRPSSAASTRLNESQSNCSPCVSSLNGISPFFAVSPFLIDFGHLFNFPYTFVIILSKNFDRINF